MIKPIRYVQRLYLYLIAPSVTALLNGSLEHAWALFKHHFRFIVRGGFRQDLYQRWIVYNEPIATELKQQAKAQHSFASRPLISVVTPVFHPTPEVLRHMLDSVLVQTYPHWEHCLVNADANDPKSEEILRAYATKDPRFRIKTLDKNFGIAENTNEAIRSTTGAWIAFLDHDDQLASFALFEVVKFINEHPDADVIFSDEDKITAAGQDRFSPFFKPDFNVDYLRSLNYMTHLMVIRRTLLESVGWLEPQYDGSQDHDLTLRLSEKTNNIYHIPKILYHWTATEGSTADLSTNKSYSVTAGEKALAAHLRRLGYTAQVLPGVFPYQPCYEIARELKVSIIVHSKDNTDVLKRMLGSVLEKTTYPNYEVVLVENCSTAPDTFAYYQTLKDHAHVKIVEWKEPFNYSLINNFGVQHASGDVLLFCHDDLEVINGNWMTRMLEYAQRQDIGVVGAKLLYPNDTIQHAGIIVGTFGIVGHSHRAYPADSPGYYNRLICAQNYSAVTAACMMTRRTVYEQVRGLDPAFKVELGDVDYCLRVLKQGYLNLWTPHALLYHYESESNGTYGTKKKKQFNSKDVTLFKARWKEILNNGDPSYNPNLTHYREDFSLTIK